MILVSKAYEMKVKFQEMFYLKFFNSLLFNSSCVVALTIAFNGMLNWWAFISPHIVSPKIISPHISIIQKRQTFITQLTTKL